jgi:hypothetical protein
LTHLNAANRFKRLAWQTSSVVVTLSSVTCKVLISDFEATTARVPSWLADRAVLGDLLWKTL